MEGTFLAAPWPSREARPSRRSEDHHPLAEASAETFRIATWEPVDLSQALVVLGFPSVGLVGGIATAHLVESLHVREVGYVLSPAFPPTTVVRNGVSASPIRVYLGDVVCGVDGECEQLCVVHSDVTPKASLVAPLAYALVAWAKEHGAKQVVCLEGLPNGSRGPEARIAGVGSDGSARDLLGRLGVPALEDGLLTGVGGVVLYAARVVNLPAMCLLAETREDFPDARGAARLLEALRPLLPLLPIDERPLYAKAEAFEIVFREQAERSKRAAGELSRRADMMFG